MKDDIALSVQNVSKQYRLGEVGTGTLSHDVNRWWHKIRGKEDPYAIVGDVNDRANIGDSDYVWALKDINFEVKKGEILGIIGKNGAGKSTLLKVLSKVTGPTTGSIKMRGRVASLLEVGTGMHPELTGRENIYLNGAILGMTRAEVARKLDEIVEFSGCAKYVDTPVKRYSSGMKVRLGFAVAAHLEPEILIVDEVLAVGDAEFQRKAVGKMQEVSSDGGRTVLFVSHNMGSIKALCSRSVVLSQGSVIYEGKTEDAVDFYLNQDIRKNIQEGFIDFSNENIGDDTVKLLEVSVTDEKNRIRANFTQSEEITFTIKFSVLEDITGMRFNFRLKTMNQEDVFMTSSHNITKDGVKKGINQLSLKVPKNLLNQTRYIFSLGCGVPGRRYIFKQFDLLNVEIEGENIGGSDFNEKWPGIICPKIDWELKPQNLL